MYGLSMELIYEGVVLGLQHWLNLFEIQNIWNILDFRQLWTPRRYYCYYYYYYRMGGLTQE